jgi:hypothetical protein
MTGFRILFCVTWHLWQQLLEAECLMAKASFLGAPEVLDPVSQGQGPSCPLIRRQHRFGACNNLESKGFFQKHGLQATPRHSSVK